MYIETEKTLWTHNYNETKGMTKILELSKVFSSTL